MSLWGFPVHQGRVGAAPRELVVTLHPLFLGICHPAPEVCTHSQASYQNQRIRNYSNLSLSPMRFKPRKLVLQARCCVVPVESELLNLGKRRKAVLSVARPVQGQLFDASVLCFVPSRRRGIHPSMSGILVTTG